VVKEPSVTLADFFLSPFLFLGGSPDTNLGFRAWKGDSRQARRWIVIYILISYMASHTHTEPRIRVGPLGTFMENSQFDILTLQGWVKLL